MFFGGRGDNASGQRGHAPALHLHCQVGRPRMAVSPAGQLAYVLATVQATDAIQAVRFPLNFCFVLDTSGSMNGKKIEAVRAAVSMLVEQMLPDDMVSVVSFSGNGKVVVPAQPVRNKQAIQHLVGGLHSGGGTQMARGMALGLEELQKFHSPQVVTRMVLLTDGKTSNKGKCLELADRARILAMPIHPMGVGSEWNEKLLDEVGNRSRGQPAEFIRAPADALAVFQQQFQSAAAVAVRNATLTLDLPMGVTPRRVMKTLPLISDLGQSGLSDRRVLVPLGDIERDIPQAVLVELMVIAQRPGGFRLAHLEVTYDVPNRGYFNETVSTDAIVEYVADGAQAQAVNADVMNIAEKASAHRLVTRALDEYRETGKVTTRLAPSVLANLDPETQAALSQLTEGQASGSTAETMVKEISQKTRRLTQRLDR
ncbi:MAG TPA: VWA domain-containing protein [Ktedonobacterales bacterium]|nr:VWA domain-containing protein [Ktedonobacterales bacterium]